MKEWNDLSMKEKAAFIHTAVRNELTNRDKIKEAYHKFDEGGKGNIVDGKGKRIEALPPRSKELERELALRDLKKLANGLNRTIGTSLTGASLLTMGLWNALRSIPKLPKAIKPFMQTLAKNASTGAKAGSVADWGQFIVDPSIEGAIQLFLNKITPKDYLHPDSKSLINVSSAADIGDIYNNINTSKSSNTRETEFNFDPMKTYTELQNNNKVK